MVDRRCRLRALHDRVRVLGRHWEPPLVRYDSRVVHLRSFRMRTEAQLMVSHWTSVQLDPETKNLHSPEWNSAGECCVNSASSRASRQIKLQYRNCIKHSFRER